MWGTNSLERYTRAGPRQVDLRRLEFFNASVMQSHPLRSPHPFLQDTTVICHGKYLSLGFRNGTYTLNKSCAQSLEDPLALGSRAELKIGCCSPFWRIEPSTRSAVIVHTCTTRRSYDSAETSRSLLRTIQNIQIGIPDIKREANERNALRLDSLDEPDF